MAGRENQDGPRTHEPSLREVTVELDGLRAVLLSELSALRQLMDERDKLYKERADSQKSNVDTALKAA